MIRPAVGSLLLLGACATHAPELSRILEPVCYSVELEGQTPAGADQELPYFGSAPEYIKLDTARFSPAITAEVRAAYASGGGEWRATDLNAWRRVAGDSVVLNSCPDIIGASRVADQCPPSPGGFVLRIAVQPDSIRGAIRSFTDFVDGRPSEGNAIVKGLRVSCSAPGAA